MPAATVMLFARWLRKPRRRTPVSLWCPARTPYRDLHHGLLAAYAACNEDFASFIRVARRQAAALGPNTMMQSPQPPAGSRPSSSVTGTVLSLPDQRRLRSSFARQRQLRRRSITNYETQAHLVVVQLLGRYRYAGNRHVLGATKVPIIGTDSYILRKEAHRAGSKVVAESDVVQVDTPFWNEAVASVDTQNRLLIGVSTFVLTTPTPAET
jgi:hypothetical protein